MPPPDSSIRATLAGMARHMTDILDHRRRLVLFLTIPARNHIMVNMFEGLEGYIVPGSEEEALVRRLDVSRLPRHVAVIMDGNGRWARERGLARIEGHRAGSDSVSEIVEASARLGIKVLSLFAFSKENWKRPRQEVSRLWALLREYLKKDGRVLSENDLRLMVIGQRDGIPRPVLSELERLEAKTRATGG